MDNLNAPIYFGDSNATVGEPFWIKCVSKQPIEWHKDGKPIQEHFVRHSKDEFSYTQQDVEKANDIIESTLSVNHALLNHGGSYKCNINFVNAHSLKVVGELPKIEEDDEEDHLESREIFTQPEEFTTIVTELKLFEDNYEHYDDIDSNEITTMRAFTTTTKHPVSHMMEAVKTTQSPTTVFEEKKTFLLPDPTKSSKHEIFTTAVTKNHKNHENIKTSNNSFKLAVATTSKPMTHSTSTQQISSTLVPTVEMKVQQMIQPKGSHFRDNLRSPLNYFINSLYFLVRF